MKTHVPILVSAALLGCNTSQIEPVSIGATSIAMPAAHPMMEFETAIPGFDERREIQLGQFCYLGTTCLTMDPRPFEVCLLGSNRCSDKLREPILVGELFTIPPAQVLVLVPER